MHLKLAARGRVGKAAGVYHRHGEPCRREVRRQPACEAFAITSPKQIPHLGRFEPGGGKNALEDFLASFRSRNVVRKQFDGGSVDTIFRLPVDHLALRGSRFLTLLPEKAEEIDDRKAGPALADTAVHLGQGKVSAGIGFLRHRHLDARQHAVLRHEMDRAVMILIHQRRKAVDRTEAASKNDHVLPGIDAIPQLLRGPGEIEISRRSVQFFKPDRLRRTDR